MSLREGDEVISINNATDEADLLVVTENGYGKRTWIAEYRQTGRAASASRPCSWDWKHAVSWSAPVSSATGTPSCSSRPGAR